MNEDFKLPPKISELLSSSISPLYVNLNFNDYSTRKPEEKKVSSIISEQAFQLQRFQEIYQLALKAKDNNIKRLDSLKQVLIQKNLEIEEQAIKNQHLESMRDELMKQKCDKLYQIKTNNSQILAKNHEDQQKLERISQENADLSKRKQSLLSTRQHLEESVSKIESCTLQCTSKLLSLTEKSSLYTLVQESYEYSLQRYQSNRIEIYQELKRLNNCLQELKGNIRVFCKVRPILPEDKSDPARLEISERAIKVFKGEKPPSTFNFDRVFGPDAGIDQVFEEISQLVQSALDGYKVCIFAYGQTGSGKTYTMEGASGPSALGEQKNNNNKGIIQKSVELMFKVSKKNEEIGWKYRFFASIIENYKDKVRDLLDASKVLIGAGSSKINPVAVQIESYEDLIPILAQGRKLRAEAETQCNMNSSRSHCLFQLRILGKKGEEEIEGILNLIDLAGSERLKASKVEGERLVETRHINKSLTALGDVIHALIKKDKHIPYRNSKLTYILENCLGGDGKTLMFVNISPLAGNLTETVNSLIFAKKVNGCSLNN